MKNTKDVKMTIYYNNVRGDNRNTEYPTKKDIYVEEDLKEIVQFDHVGAEYKDSYRKNENFIQANCTMFDVDNDDIEDPDKWISPEDIQNAFPGVMFYVSYSRNHMKEKNGKSARPKFHVYFPDNDIKDFEIYKALKSKVCSYFSGFDDNAKDAARFFFGVEKPNVKFYSGEKLLCEFMQTVQLDDSVNDSNTITYSLKDNEIIPEGRRNNTLFKTVCQYLCKWGNTQKTWDAYKLAAEQCVPRLPEKEIETIKNSALKYFYKSISHVADSCPKLMPKDFTDLGQAEIFADKYKRKLCYSAATGYLCYTGRVWVEDDVKARLYVQRFLNQQLQESVEILENRQKQENEMTLQKNTEGLKEIKAKVRMAERYRNFSLKYRHTNRISAIFKESQPLLEIDTNMLDVDGFMLNTPEGCINLRTNQMHPNDPEDYCTKMTAVAPSNQGAAIFQDFLRKITCDDYELAAYLQLIAGMCALGTVFCENLIIAYGTGKNGKSTLFNLLAKVLGNYAGNISSEVLTTNWWKNKGPEYAELRGKRIVIAPELEEGAQLNTAVVKRICSTDPIFAEKKYKDPFKFNPSHTVILYTNHLPKVGSLDRGIWRRLVVVPFLAVIEEKEEVKNFCDYLYKESGGAVLAWMIGGTKKFIDQEYKISQPRAVKEAIDSYYNKNDIISRFIDDCCELQPTLIQKSGELYKSYQCYCAEQGEHPCNSSAFKTAIEKKGCSWRRTNTGAYYTGIRLRK